MATRKGARMHDIKHELRGYGRLIEKDTPAARFSTRHGESITERGATNERSR